MGKPVIAEVGLTPFYGNSASGQRVQKRKTVKSGVPGS